MIVTHYEQGSPDWHHARCGVRTASRFKDVLATAPAKWRVLRANGGTAKLCASEEEAQAVVDAAVKAKYTIQHEPPAPLAAYRDYLLEQACEIVTGVFDDGDGFSNFWMERGHELEPDARAWYEFVTGRTVRTCGLILTDDQQVGASVDGLVEDDGEVEIKCLKRTNHMAIVLANEVPEEHIPQIQGQLYVTGRAWCDFIAYHPLAPVPGFVKRVERDEVYIARLKQGLAQFNRDLDAMVANMRDLQEAA